MKKLLRSFGVRLARSFGSEIRDAETGDVIGRALLISWGGRVHIIGLEQSVRPVFLPQRRLTYWKQSLGFTLARAVDFPNERDRPPDGSLDS
jgi:hypothetical protein